MIYQATPEYGAHLLTELERAGRPIESLAGLHWVGGARVSTVWHQNVWLEPVEIKFTSISDAAKRLRELGAFWAHVPTEHHRKAALIQEKLPRLPQKRRAFPFELPSGPMGSWALKDEHTLWASATTTSPFAGGVIPLEENKVDPPSSAYLKLQEALTLYGTHPGPNNIVLDAGSSPGGWTWVLAQLGATVHSVDRSPLDSRMDGLDNVQFRTGNAFALQPQQFERLDWFFSDVICYPAKLWDWLQPWLEDGRVKHFVVTIKMQGSACDWETLSRFQNVPGSRLMHLHHNKHELTWML